MVATFEPLQWPQCWRERSAVQRFLAGTWLCGIEKRTHREICRQLEERDVSRIQAWADAGVDMTLYRQVFAWIKEYFHWPNTCFVPDDSMEILLWDHEAVAVDHNLSLVRLLMDIEDNIGEVPDDKIEAVVSGGTLGQFMTLLMEIKGQ